MKLMYSTQKIPDNEVVFIKLKSNQPDSHDVTYERENGINEIRIDAVQDIFC